MVICLKMVIIRVSALGFLLLAGLLIFVHVLISARGDGDSSPFECGFSPNGYGRRPFSLRFFLLAVLFLIFDVELVIMYPVVFWETKYCVLRRGIFILILLAGLFHEGSEGSLEWKI